MPAVPRQRRAFAEQATARGQDVAGDAGVFVAAVGPAAGLAYACGTSRTIESEGGIDWPFGGATTALHWADGERELDEAKGLHVAARGVGTCHQRPVPCMLPGMFSLAHVTLRFDSADAATAAS